MSLVDKQVAELNDTELVFVSDDGSLNIRDAQVYACLVLMILKEEEKKVLLKNFAIPFQSIVDWEFDEFSSSSEGVESSTCLTPSTSNVVRSTRTNLSGSWTPSAIPPQSSPSKVRVRKEQMEDDKDDELVIIVQSSEEVVEEEDNVEMRSRDSLREEQQEERERSQLQRQRESQPQPQSQQQQQPQSQQQQPQSQQQQPQSQQQQRQRQSQIQQQSETEQNVSSGGRRKRRIAREGSELFYSVLRSTEIFTT